MASHRAHASVEEVTHFLPSAAGFFTGKNPLIVQAVNPCITIYIISGVSFRQDRRDRKSFEKVDALLIGGMCLCART